MKEQKQSESGSMMLEVMAVLAILAAITPVLYKQALLRNIEISNINIAAEMRMVKETLQEYVPATCPSEWQNCELSIKDAKGYAPDGMESILDNYDVVFCDYEIGSGATLETAYSETLTSEISAHAKRRYAFITDMNPPELKWNLHRAKRVASLIGTEAGVCNEKGTIGVNGAWKLEDNVCADGPFVVVHTGLNIWK